MERRAMERMVADFDAIRAAGTILQTSGAVLRSMEVAMTWQVFGSDAVTTAAGQSARLQTVRSHVTGEVLEALGAGAHSAAHELGETDRAIERGLQ